MKPVVSVVIPTLNEGKYIKQTLESIKNQTYKKIEIIVCDSYSKDNTVKIAKKYTNKVIVKKTNVSEARNLGAEQAKGNILVFVDADTILTRTWIEDVLKVFEKSTSCVSVVGNGRSIERNFKAYAMSFIWFKFYQNWVCSVSSHRIRCEEKNIFRSKWF